MRRIVVTTYLLLVVVVTPWLGAQPKGERRTIQGEVVDLWCYLEAGDRGSAKRECATSCAKAGNPIGLVDRDGQVYVTVGLKDHEPGSVKLLDKMSQEVVVTGTVVRNGGVQMIYLDSVK